MTGGKEKEEIIVKAPSKPVVSAEKKAERTLERSLEEERFDLLEVLSEFGGYFGVAVVAVGIVLLCLFAFVGASGQTGLLVLSSESSMFSMFLWIFVGLLNIIGGFLLIGHKE